MMRDWAGYREGQVPLDGGREVWIDVSSRAALRGAEGDQAREGRKGNARRRAWPSWDVVTG